jgi:hypothetical protein
MSRELYLAPVAPRPLAGAAVDRNYRSLLCSVGYESRSRAIAEQLHTVVEDLHGVEFHHHHNEVYEENRRRLDEIGAQVQRLDDEQFSPWVTRWLANLAGDGIHVGVDISSMSRPRIAGVIQAIMALPNGAQLTVDLLYTPAQYEPAPREMPDATEALDPVISAFAGAPADPQQPLVLIFGLGYEPERAASALDEFAPQGALPFFPVGRDQRFERDVQNANVSVLELSEVRDPVRYAIEDPFRTFCDLEVVVETIRAGTPAFSAEEGTQRPARPLLLPLGPKIFAATCMLVAAAADPPVPVWRVSSGVFGEAQERHSDGSLVTLRVSTAPLAPPDPLQMAAQPTRNE